MYLSQLDLFKGRYGHAAVAEDEDTIYVYGGYDTAICDDGLCLDVKKNTWRRQRIKR